MAKPYCARSSVAELQSTAAPGTVFAQGEASRFQAYLWYTGQIDMGT